MDKTLVRRQQAMMKLYGRLPTGRPFTTAHPRQCGVSYDQLRALVLDGLLVRPIEGVHHARGLPDSLAMRVAVLKLVTPPNAVVTDRTAAWLWRAERVLAPGAHVEIPRVSMYCLPGSRLRNKLVDSGQRMLRPGDVQVVDGLNVTTPLRTACDVGRLLHRDQAIGVMDSLAALGRFTVESWSQRSRGSRGSGAWCR